MDKGKDLEDKTRKWLKELDVHFNRLYDARSMHTPNAPSRPADFYMYINRMLIYIECKEDEKKLICISRIRPSQFKAAKLSEKFGYKYVFLFSFNDELFGVEWSAFSAFLTHTNKKSINRDDCQEIGSAIMTSSQLYQFLIAS